VLAEFLGCDADERAVYEHRLAADPAEYTSSFLRATNTELLLVDDGYPAEGEGTSWDELGELAGCRALPVLRLEIRGQHAADEVATALGVQAEKQLAANDTAGARKIADAAAELRPDAPATHLMRARLAKAGGESKTAEGEYRKAVEGFSDAKSDAGAGARLELATLLVADGSGSEAAKLAEEVVGARGDDGRGLDTLGRACDLTKDVDCARKAYERLAQLSPGTDGATQEAIDHAKGRMKLLKSKKAGKAGKGGKKSKKRGRH